MKFCLASLYMPNYAPLAALTIDQNKIPYCERHGYEWCVMVDGFGDNLGFDKIRHILDIMEANESYDWIYYCGCDTLITNFNILLEDLADNDFHLIIANDVNGWNADSFLIRCSPEGRDFMQRVLAEEPRLKSHVWAEQMGMIELGERLPHLVKVLPQKMLNSCQYDLYGFSGLVLDKLGNPGEWTPGDFLIHWSGCGLQQRLKLAEKYLPLVQR
jgi:hypothetical protein